MCEYMIFNHKFLFISFFQISTVITISICRRPTFAAIMQTLRVFKTRIHKNPYFLEKIPLFHSMEKIPLFHSMEKIPLFHSMEKITFFHTFTEFRAIFKTSVFLKNSPIKVRLEFLTKIPCYSIKFPV